MNGARVGDFLLCDEDVRLGSWFENVEMGAFVWEYADARPGWGRKGGSCTRANVDTDSPLSTPARVFLPPRSAP